MTVIYHHVSTMIASLILYLVHYHHLGWQTEVEVEGQEDHSQGGEQCLAPDTVVPCNSLDAHLPKRALGSQSPLASTAQRPLTVSWKQWLGSWWAVRIRVSWPCKSEVSRNPAAGGSRCRKDSVSYKTPTLACSARLQSTMSLSAPPIPRSGWRNTTLTILA